MDEPSREATEINRRTIRQAFEAWRHGAGPITDVFAAEMVWRIEGHSAASREYGSKQQFIDEVLAPFAARFQGLSSSAPSGSDRSTPTATRSSSSGTAAASQTTGNRIATAMRGSCA